MGSQGCAVQLVSPGFKNKVRKTPMLRALCSTAGCLGEWSLLLEQCVEVD